MRFTKSAKIMMIVLFPIALVGGLYLGAHMPSFGLLALLVFIPLIIWVLMSNKQGARLSGAALDSARELRAPTGKARVFVTRRGFVGSQQGMNIAVAGYEGQMRLGFLLVADVDPGTIAIDARMNKQSEKTRATHDLTLAPGQVVLLQVGIQSGMVRASPYFEEVIDRDDIRPVVSKAKPIAWLKTPAIV